MDALRRIDNLPSKSSLRCKINTGFGGQVTRLKSEELAQEQEPDFSQQEALLVMVPDVLDAFKDLDVALGPGAVAYATEDSYDHLPLAFVVAEDICKYFKIKVEVVVECGNVGGVVTPHKIYSVTISDGPAADVLYFIQVWYLRYLYGTTRFVCGATAGTLEELIDRPRFKEEEEAMTGVRLLSRHTASLSDSDTPVADLSFSDEVCKAREAAKSIIRCGLAQRCVVKIMRRKDGEAVFFVHTFGTGKLPESEILELVSRNIRCCDHSETRPTASDMLQAMRKDFWVFNTFKTVDLDPIISPILQEARYMNYGDLEHTRAVPNDWTGYPLPLKELRNGWRFVSSRDYELSVRPSFQAYYGKLRPYPISPRRLEVPSGIRVPEWALDGRVSEDLQKRPKIRSSQEIESLRNACRVAEQTLGALRVRPGMTTEGIDKFVHEHIISSGAYPSLLNFHSYPKSCHTSVNEAICKGIPDCRRLEDGDIVKVHVVVFLDSMHGMSSRTFLVGNQTDLGKRLIKCTEECIAKVLDEAKPLMGYKNLKSIISGVAKSHGFIMSLASPPYAGIGDRLDCPPRFGQKPRMEPGHTFAVEALVNAATGGYNVWQDGTCVKNDGKPSAALGRTFLMTERGAELLCTASH